MSDIKVNLLDFRTKNKIYLSKKNKINIYLCGPTVYDRLHVGNFRNIVVFEALVNFLRKNGFQVSFLQNITDIDDKIFKKSRDLKVSEKDISFKFFKKYLLVLEKMKISSFKMEFVTKKMQQIVNFISELNKKNLVYFLKDGIYFDISKLKNEYNSFRNFVSQEARFAELRNLETISEKKKIEDFIVWKFVSDKDSWNSPWGKGRPGWHTECVALIWDFLDKDQELTIHGGGADLMFPHHANERIQYLGLTGKELSKIWFHNGFVNFQEKKISKSNLKESTSFFVEDLLKSFSNNTLKLFYLSFLTSNSINFSLNLLRNFAKKIEKIEGSIKELNWKSIVENKETKEVKYLKKEVEIFNSYLANNFNSPKALDFIFKLLKVMNKKKDEKIIEEALEYKETIIYCLEILGIFLEIPTINEENKRLILQWFGLLQEKKFKKADEIRNQLQKKKIF